MNLTINCSSDRLQVRIGSDYYQLSNRGLEVSFGPKLIEWIKTYEITTIFVINGPGSFTTLRVVCLMINLYKTLHPELTVYHTTKTQLYHAMAHDLGIDQMYVYIGQRNNLRLYVFETQNHVIIPKSDIVSGVMIDDVSSEYCDSIDCIMLSVCGEEILATRHDYISTHLLTEVMQKVDVLYPHYLMEPNIG